MTSLLMVPALPVAPGGFQGLDPVTAGFPEGTVYLLHLAEPYVGRTGRQAKYFQHYTGHAEPGCLVSRMAEHGTQHGARCMMIAAQAGIPWILARTWPGGYDRERQLKRQGSAFRYCPACGVVPRGTQAGRAR